MTNYDGRLRGAKDYVTKLLCALAADKKVNVADLGAAIDELNKAWDELTDCLVRQRDERTRTIVSLLDQLAERKPR